jgi:hypothetical protein
MPPAQDDLNRQLEALQRYVSDLHQQRAHAKAAAPPPAPAVPAPRPRRPSRRWLGLTGLLVTLALAGGVVVGAVAWSDERPAGGRVGVVGAAAARSSPASSRVVPVAAAACKTAVDRANAMLASAVRLQRELAEYGRILGDPATRGLSGGEVVDRMVPSLQAGAGESARFERALADYRQIVDQCQLHTP